MQCVFHERQMARITSDRAPFRLAAKRHTAIPALADRVQVTQTWTAIRQYGPDHLGVRSKRPNHLGSTAGAGGEHPDAHVLRAGPRRGELPRPTAAIPMENPYCSCKLLTRRNRLDHGHDRLRRDRGDADGESWLTATTPVENPYRSCKPTTRVRPTCRYAKSRSARSSCTTPRRTRVRKGGALGWCG